MAMRLFVGGLSWDTTEDSLKQFFSQAGTVTSVSIITDKFSGKSKGFGFVEFASDEDAKKAIAELNGKELDNRTLTINEARPMQPRENRGGFGGGGGGFNRGGGRGGDRPRGGDRRGGPRF